LKIVSERSESSNLAPREPEVKTGTPISIRFSSGMSDADVKEPCRRPSLFIVFAPSVRLGTDPETCPSFADPFAMKRSTRIVFILIFATIVAGLFLLRSPIAQPTDYHDFADQRALVGIPNFLNVISSLALVFVGGSALAALFRNRPESERLFLESRERLPWLFLFSGTLLTGLGSIYYHWSPSNGTLFWDRLPLTLIVTSLLAAVISERISVKSGLRWLAPLLIIGLASVVYWSWSETRGAGDLRFYALVHYLPLLLIPLLILLFPPRYTRTGDYFSAFGFYLLAKIAEKMDASLYSIGGLISGHTIKHLLAALALYWLFHMILRRKPVPSLRPLEKSSTGNRKRKQRS